MWLSCDNLSAQQLGNRHSNSSELPPFKHPHGITSLQASSWLLRWDITPLRKSTGLLYPACTGTPPALQVWTVPRLLQVLIIQKLSWDLTIQKLTQVLMNLGQVIPLCIQYLRLPLCLYLLCPSLDKVPGGSANQVITHLYFNQSTNNQLCPYHPIR